jgi:cobalt-zinc-cadmium efflux system outer membrane protein
MNDEVLQKVRRMVLAGMAVCALPAQAMAASADPAVWTLQRSVARAVAVAPEMGMAQADVRASLGDLDKADDWPNPSLSIDVTNNIRRMYNESGYSMGSVSLSQPLPLWRLHPQMRVAREGLLAAQEGAAQTRLAIEARAARLFLALQMRHARLQLAEQRQAFARRLIRVPGHGSGDGDGDAGDEAAVVRYVKPLDRSRLQLLAETARDDADAAKNSYQEALSGFRNYLGLASAVPVRLQAMQVAAAPAPLPKLLQQGGKHAVVLRRLKYRLKAAEAGVALQKARRLDDPVLSFEHGRNVNIYNFSYSYDSVQLSVGLPLWDRNAGNIEKAQAAVERNQSRLAIAERDLRGRLSQDHMRLNHVLDQTRRFKRYVLQPAHRLLRETERHYDVGQATSLALVDAYNTYFDAKNRYLDLLYRGQQIAINLRWHLGTSLLQGDGARP